MIHNTLLVVVILLATPIATNVYAEAKQKKSMQVNVIITFNVKPDKVNSFLEIMDSVKKNCPNVKGWRSVKVYHDIESPTVFTLVELWASKELHQHHLSGVIESGDWENISQHLVSDPVSRYFKEL